MVLKESILTKNPCYTAGRKIVVKGLMLHSVGVPQPNASVFLTNWNKASYNAACVHGFIDANDGTVYQTLPWDHRGWHCGASANNTHIGVEMCEPYCLKYSGGASFTCSDPTAAKAAVKRTYDAAVELFAMLCQRFGLDPLADGVIISHHEGALRGVASNHGDPEHLWNQLGTGYTMDGFRKAVKSAMGKTVQAVPSTATSSDTDTEKVIWNALYAKIGNAYGVAGLMGNLYAESGLRPNNLQDTYERSLGLSDVQYTEAVDSGAYTNFVHDSAGYGLAQWTYYSRKQGLLDYARSKGRSVGDLGTQIDFLWKELSEGYKGLVETLKNATTVLEASNAVLTQFERPADQGATMQAKRSSYGVTYFNRYAAGSQTAQPGTSPAASIPYTVRVKTGNLNIRKGPGMNYAATGKYTGSGVFTIVEEKPGSGSSLGWGKLKSGQGWISLDYCVKN